jgi:protoheme IX farnesyltransferase
LGGPLYTLVAAIFGAFFLVFAYDCYRKREGEAAERAAKNLFAYSILYLFVLFAVLLVEHGFGLNVGALALTWTL